MIQKCMLEIPEGWYVMVQQMFEDLAQLNEDITFIQIKEKFNTLRCYYAGKISKEAKEILQKYEAMAEYVCCNCGKPAIYETTDYILSFCEDCYDERNPKEDLEITSHSFENEWNRYLVRIGEK